MSGFDRTLKPALFGVAATLGAALCLMPSAAMAQGTPASWEQCLRDARPSTQNVPPGPMDQDPTKDEVILDFDDALSDAQIKAWGKAHGLDVHLNSPHSDAPNLYLATVSEGAVPALKTCLARDGALELVEENFSYALFANVREHETFDPGSTVPNDPLYQFQWNFKQVGAEASWKTSTGRDVVVSVIDTGVAQENDPGRGIKSASDLAGTGVAKGYDFVDKSDFVFDGHGHGTHVAGTIAQTTNNRLGVAGLAYNAKIMGLRVLNSRGFGQVADIADAVRFSADHGAHVINMSLGGPLPSLVLKRAITYAHNKGVTIVAAAGNSGRRAPSFPAAYEHVIAVAATQFDKNTTFYSQWGNFVDIAAPGGNTRVDQNGDGRPDGVLQQTLKEGSLAEHDFVLYMGTSMASPHVAAIAAQVIAQGVTHPDKVEAILKRTADDSLKERFDTEQEFQERFGAGLIRADKAVQQANAEQGVPRSLAGLLLALLAIAGVRRKDILGLSVAHKGRIVLTSGLVAGGLFFLPWVFGDSTIVSMLSKPLAEMDILIFGLGWHQNPLMASALIPLGAYALLGGKGSWRALACGVALGMAGFLLTESVLLTSDVRWIPGMGMLDRAWLLAHGVLSLGLGYVGLKRY